jgi:hypothetical protein
MSRRRGPAAALILDEPAETGEDSKTVARWRDRCVQLQLSEEYVTSQTRQIIDEYSCLMSMALTEAMNQMQSLREASVVTSNSTATARNRTQSVVTEATHAGGLLQTLVESLVKVDGMAGLIASVANRTNLLSLNATIEAARAGEAGKGFAVVAREVKELATVTATSTTEISGTVEELRTQVAAVAMSLQNMTDGVASIDQAASNVAELMTRQQEAMESLDMQVNDANSQMELLSMLVGSVDRRQHARVASGGGVSLRSGDLRVDTQLLDLSVGGLGCSVLRTVQLPVGAQVEVTLPLVDAALCMDAVVRRRTPAGGRDDLGLEFQNLSDTDTAAISGYISYLAQGEGVDPDAEARPETDANRTEKELIHST